MADTIPPITEIQAISASPNVRTEEFGDQHRDLALWMKLDLSASLELRAERAVHVYNTATMNMVEAGLLLASVHAEVGVDGFAAVLGERGMSKQRAYELMRGASLAARLSPAQRQQVLGYSKSKVLALAGASPVAVQAALEDDDLNIDLISVRQLKQRIRELERDTSDLRTQRDTALGNASGLSKELLELKYGTREDKVPPTVAALRIELLVLQKKAEMALDGVRAVGVDLVGLAGDQVASPWADSTLRLAVAGLASIGLQLQGVLSQYLKAAPEVDAPLPGMAHLSPQESKELQRRFQAVVAVEQHEKEGRRVDAINAEKDANRARGARLKRPGDRKGKS